MTRHQLALLAQAFLDAHMPVSANGHRFVVVEDAIREAGDGWFVPYANERFLKTRDIMDSDVGNAPVFIARDGLIGFRLRDESPFQTVGHISDFGVGDR
ncbi:YrhB domain-containing protein [Caulobacter sp. 17J80-11]|uniref:YrhB domain-containing protein n=1 Tax=Caulobacter sp. 17J80-11 TaxID=2763502 RepID=UPI001653BC0D|nr:YrhB domain-containing protein [Caulobacter sp. 17J80-11]MBC6981399.1 hypothetical protein [Caulobacter sp. 17J80-11]